MTRRRVESARLSCAVLLACYGILSVIATGPHLHELRPAGCQELFSASGAAAVIVGPSSENAAGHGQRVAHCMLCAWSRSTARPTIAARLLEVEPPRVAPRPTPSETFVDIPSEATALLRAPPQA